MQWKKSICMIYKRVSHRSYAGPDRELSQKPDRLLLMLRSGFLLTVFLLHFGIQILSYTCETEEEAYFFAALDFYVL